MSGDHNTYQKDCYGDGNVYRGERSKDSEVKTLWVGLTMEDVAELRRGGAYTLSDRDAFAVDAKLREKNT